MKIWVIIAILTIQSLVLSLPLLWPQPLSIIANEQTDAAIISPCEIKYVIDAYATVSPYIQQTLDFYQDNVFKCPQKISGYYSLTITVRSANYSIATEVQQEAYSLIARQTVRWELTADYYVGFLRGFETFSQLFTKNADNNFIISGLPITIDDVPQFKWRGIMIDSSRHFLPVSKILKTIDALMFNKMNILHWHIIDQDSFPFQIPSIPQLSQSGKIGGTYSPNDIQQVLNYAKLRGVRVVVQIDTPAHTHSWGRSQKYQQTVVKCNSVFTGQFDPTLDLTYDLVKQVMNYTNSVFNDPYIHFGGDETSGPCWDLKPSIKQWMINNNMSAYKQLQTYYRNRQKSIWRNISATKKIIYWANEAIDLPLQPDDILQWWGISTNLNRLVGRPNEVILSSYDFAYLDKGFGNRNGISYGDYIKWRDIYAFNPRLTGVNVIGGQVCMWSQLSNAYTHQQKIWIRSSVMAERLWNDNIDIKVNLKNIAERLVAHATRLKERGYKVSPVTVQLCEQDLSICFD